MACRGQGQIMSLGDLPPDNNATSDVTAAASCLGDSTGSSRVHRKVPDYNTQKNKIKQLEDLTLHVGEIRFLVSMNWWSKWKRYVGYNLYDRAQIGQQDPGPVSNSCLFTDVETGILKNHLVKEADYHSLHESAWEKLTDWYGLEKNSKQIKRRVILQGMYSKRLEVEVYPLELELYIWPNLKEGRKRMFSRIDTVGYVENCIKEEFGVDGTECQLMRFSDCRAIDRAQSENLSNREQTLEDAGIFHRQNKIVLEGKLQFKVRSTEHTRVSIVPPLVDNSSTAFILPPDMSPGKVVQRKTEDNGKCRELPDVTVTTVEPTENSDSGNSPECKSLLPKPYPEELNVEQPISKVQIVDQQKHSGTNIKIRPDKSAVSAIPKTVTCPGHCGLINLGNTCFMNSALQCLSNTEPLRKYFLPSNDGFAPYKHHINGTNPLGMGGAIAKAFGDLLEEMWSGRNCQTAPRNFKAQMGKLSPLFAGYQQQDSQELMNFVLDGLHEDLNLVEEKPYVDLMEDDKSKTDEEIAEESWFKHLQRNQSVIVKLFQGQLMARVTCPLCKNVSRIFDPFTFLSLPLPARRTTPIDISVIRNKSFTSESSELVVKYKVMMSSNAKVRELKQELMKLTDISTEKMAIIKVWSTEESYTYTVYKDEQHIQYQPSTHLFALELIDSNGQNQECYVITCHRERVFQEGQCRCRTFGVPIVVKVPLTSLNRAGLRDIAEKCLILSPQKEAENLTQEVDRTSFDDTNARSSLGDKSDSNQNKNQSEHTKENPVDADVNVAEARPNTDTVQTDETTRVMSAAVTSEDSLSNVTKNRLQGVLRVTKSNHHGTFSVEDASATSSHHQTGEEDSGEIVHTTEKGTQATDSQDDNKLENDPGLNEELTYIDDVEYHCTQGEAEKETETIEDSLSNTKQKTKDKIDGSNNIIAEQHTEDATTTDKDIGDIEQTSIGDVTSDQDASATTSHHQTGEEDSGESVHTTEKGTPATDSQDDDKPESDHGLNEEMTYIDEVEEETEPTEDSLPNMKQETKDKSLAEMDGSDNTNAKLPTEDATTHNDTDNNEKDSNKHNVATNETHGICVSSDVTEHADPESVLKLVETITNKDSLPVFDQAVAVVSNMSNKTGDLDVTNVNDDTDHHGEDAQDASTASSHNLVDKIVESSVDKQAATRNEKKSNLFELTLVTRNGRSMQIPDREMKKPANQNFILVVCDWHSSPKWQHFDPKSREAKHSSYTEEQREDRKDTDLKDCLKLMSGKSILDNWYCTGECKRFVPVLRTFNLWKLPMILIVHLKRFSNDRFGRRQKLSTLVDFQIQQFELRQFVTNPNDPDPVYDLFAVCNHTGTIHGGHYTAYVKTKSEEKEKWVKCDDTRIDEISESQLVTSAAFVLFYSRCNPVTPIDVTRIKESITEEMKRLSKKYGSQQDLHANGQNGSNECSNGAKETENETGIPDPDIEQENMHQPNEQSNNTWWVEDTNGIGLIV